MSAVKRTPLPLVAAVVFLAFVACVPAASAAATVSGENSPDVGRISKVEGNVFTLAKDDVDWSYAEPNLVIEDEDLFQTDESGRAELQFPDEVIIRIGENSRIAILALKQDDGINLDGGRAYIRLGKELPGDKQLLVSFASGEFVAHEPVLARIDVAADGSAQINIIRGSAGVASLAEGGREISAGRSVLIAADGEMEEGNYRTASVDDFDRWNEQLDVAFTTQPRPEYLEADLVGAEDLNGYGRWVYADTYSSYAWQPYVVETWRPYYYGHWYKSRYYGWTWIPQEPWGYVTYHYGCWNYDPHFGWIWVPGYVWRPAHVYWVEYDSYIGWVPLGYYGYPVITTYPYHVVYPSYIDFFSFTFVHTRHFHHYDHHYYYHHDRRHDRDYHDYDRDHRDDDHRGDNHRDGDDRDRFDRDYDKLRKDDDAFREKYKSRERHEVPLNAGKRVIASEKSQEDSKVKFAKDLNRDDLKRGTHKGRTDRSGNEYTKFIDTKRDPAVAKKIDKLERTKISGPATRRPEKPTAEQVRKITTRPAVLEKRAETLRHKAAPQEVDQTRKAPVRLEPQKDRPVNRPAPEFKEVPTIKQREIDRQTRQRDTNQAQVKSPAREVAKNNAPSTKERLERDRQVNEKKFAPDMVDRNQQVRISKDDKRTAAVQESRQKIERPSRPYLALEKMDREEKRELVERTVTNSRRQNVPQMKAREQAPPPAAQERVRETRQVERQVRAPASSIADNERVRVEQRAPSSVTRTPSPQREARQVERQVRTTPSIGDNERARVQQRSPSAVTRAPLPQREARQVRPEMRAPERPQVEVRQPEPRMVQPQAQPVIRSDEGRAIGRQDTRMESGRSDGRGWPDARSSQSMRSSSRGRGR